LAPETALKQVGTQKRTKRERTKWEKTTERGLRKKLDNKYCGPYRVTKLFGNDRYKIRSVKGMRGYKNFGAVVAVDALRPYHGLMGGENSDSGDSEDEIRDRQDLIDLLEG
jgi:hypothetical protein